MSTEAAQLKGAIDSNDLDRVKSLMTGNPALHRAPLGYGEDGPLTWVAECRVPWEPPSPARLAIAEWMIDNGSDVHQGGDGPLMRAALNGYRIPMLELLVRRGADVNAFWHGNYPIIFAPCESLDRDALQWLLDHGANPNCREHGFQVNHHDYEGTALDYLLGSYVRDTGRLSACIDILLNAGATTRYDAPGVLDLLRGRVSEFSADPHRHYPELDIGKTGGRSLTVQGGTLLHVAAEYILPEAAARLLDRGADPNALGDAGQTPIFHAVSQFNDAGLPVAKILIENGASLSIRAVASGSYEIPGEVIECTPLGYARRFGGEKTLAILRDHGAVE